MTDELVANQYSQALFELATEKKLVSQYLNDLKVIEENLNQAPALERVFLTPYIPGMVKKKIFTDYFSDKVCQDVLSFLFLLAVRGRTQHIRHVIVHFQHKVIEQKNIRPTELVVAAPPEPGVIEQVKKEMADITGKTIDLSVTHDPSIIGGFKIVFGDRVLDFTLKGQLNKIAAKLHETPISGG